MPLLSCLDIMDRTVDYYALDLSPAEVRSSLDAMSLHPFKHVRCHGLIGTFDDARSWLQSIQTLTGPNAWFL